MQSQNGKKQGNRKDRRSGKGNKQYTRRNSSKDTRRDAEIVGTSEAELRQSTSNPYTWYAAFPNYAKDVATLAFGTPLGQPMYFNSTDYVANAGIMSILFTPSVGLSYDQTSPINRQAVRFYTYLRSVMRAASSYDAADTMMYMMGIDSLYTFWAYMRRAYGVAQLFTPTNTYLPRRLLQAMGISPDIVNNLADFRAFINRYALNIGRFALPKDFDIVARHMWMCSGLYADSDTNRAQLYMFVPRYLYQWDNTVATGSALIGQTIVSNGTSATALTLDNLITIANNLINNFNNDEDTMNISGDIYRAYGAAGCLTVEETADNYAIVPVYDKTVLSQIENLHIFGEFTTSLGAIGAPSITQDPSVNNGAIIFNPIMQLGATTLGEYKLANWVMRQPRKAMNMHWDSPTPEQIMEASRLMGSCVESLAATSVDAYTLTLPADIVNGINVWVTSLNSPTAVQFINMQTQTVWKNTGTSAIVNSTGLDAVVILQQFDWAPMFYYVDVDPTATTTNLRLVCADVDNFTLVSNTQLKNMNEAALLSLLEIREPAKL